MCLGTDRTVLSKTKGKRTFLWWFFPGSTVQRFKGSFFTIYIFYKEVFTKFDITIIGGAKKTQQGQLDVSAEPRPLLFSEKYALLFHNKQCFYHLSIFFKIMLITPENAEKAYDCREIDYKIFPRKYVLAPSSQNFYNKIVFYSNIVFCQF